MSFKWKGKIPPHVLSDLIFSKLPTTGEGVLLGPSIGEDAAILDPKGELIAVHSDPVTGGGRLAGWLSVYVACNDVATRGVRPRWLLTVFLFREGVTKVEVDELVDQVGSAAREVGAAIVGGHTEVTPGLEFNIIVTTAIGTGSRILNTRDARPGDLVVLTKAAALEGTAIIASELEEKLKKSGVPEASIERAKGFIKEISVVKEALIAAKGYARAMHDPTEGGLLGGVQELAMASGSGFRIYEERVPIRRETMEFSLALGFDPLRLISSGSLLIAVRRERAGDLLEELSRKGIDASIIGEITKEGFELVRKDGRVEDLSEPVEDELWRLLESS